jgi:hypothetical protein
MLFEDRVLYPEFRARMVSADEAAALIAPGDRVGMSGFTGAGYPKAVPEALARRMQAAHARGEDFRIGLWTGASTAPELDGVLAQAHGINMRMPYQSDPSCRKQINAGDMQYMDIHLSHVAPFVWFGFFGKLVLGGQQQDLAGPGRQGHSGGEPVAARRTRRHARHLLRHRPAAAPRADSAGAAARPHWRAVFARRP